MPLYLAQCEHIVGENDIRCKQCHKQIARIWDINKLGLDNVLQLVKSWNNNIKPSEFYAQEILPYDREEYVFQVCAAWDEKHPTADENTRESAFKKIISDILWDEYKKSCEDREYYNTLAIIRRHRDYIRI